MPGSNALNFYDDSDRAERYQRRKGFAPERTERMRETVVDLLTACTPVRSRLLELGAGTGHLTQKVLGTNHFREIHVTDGAPTMMQIARQTLEAGQSELQFTLLDFTTDWPALFTEIGFDAVASSMALHHAADKQRLFQQIFAVLKPQGVFVLADHMSGASDWTERLLVRERALVRLGRENQADHARLEETMRMDVERGRKEGNLCESVAQYEQYLDQCGFKDVECVWRDYWLAVFVARKQA